MPAKCSEHGREVASKAQVNSPCDYSGFAIGEHTELARPARKWAASCAAAPMLLEWLASDPDEGVRQEVATNPSTPTAILERLASDPDKVVRDTALLRVRILEFFGACW